MKSSLLLKNNLKSIRLKKGLSQQDLAKMVGTTRQTIIAIEKSGFNPSVRLALLLSIALETKIEEMFYF